MNAYHTELLRRLIKAGLVTDKCVGCTRQIKVGVGICPHCQTEQ